MAASDTIMTARWIFCIVRLSHFSGSRCHPSEIMHLWPKIHGVTLALLGDATLQFGLRLHPFCNCATSVAANHKQGSKGSRMGRL
jgi:hypothetical protein